MSRRRPPMPKLLAIALLAVLPALSAQAAPQSQDRDRNPQRGEAQDKRQDSRSSLSDAVRRVERDTRGEVLSAERVQYDGRDMHRVKVVDDQGRVRVFMQDPQRGRSKDDDAARSNRNAGQGSGNRQKPTQDDDD